MSDDKKAEVSYNHCITLKHDGSESEVILLREWPEEAFIVEKVVVDVFVNDNGVIRCDDADAVEILSAGIGIKLLFATMKTLSEFRNIVADVAPWPKIKLGQSFWISVHFKKRCMFSVTLFGKIAE